MILIDRCVFDTNVLVSAAINDASVPGRADFWVLDHGTLLGSPETFDELNDVLGRKKLARYLDDEDRKRFVANLTEKAKFLQPAETIRVCRDPDDDKFLELAVAGSATCMVTGDEDLLALHPFRGIPILTPTQFLESLVE